MSGATQRREIDLHRRVCVVEPDRIEVRPARSAAVVPLLGLLLGILAIVGVVLWLERLPFALVLLMMASAMLLVPLSGMGFVYSLYGATVVIDRERQSAVWQQGLLGMGVGAREMVPFSDIERLEVEETDRREQGSEPREFAQYEILLIETGGRRLSLGQVTVPRSLEAEGLARARQVAQAVAALVGKPVHGAGDERRQRRRRRRRRQPTTAGV